MNARKEQKEEEDNLSGLQEELAEASLHPNFAKSGHIGPLGLIERHGALCPVGPLGPKSFPQFFWYFELFLTKSRLLGKLPGQD